MARPSPAKLNDSSRADGATRRGRRSRRVLAALLTLACLASLSLLVVTRPAVLAQIVQWRMGIALNGDVTIGEARWLGGGDVRLDRVVVRVPGWPGEAGEVLSAGRIEATVSRSRLLAGSVVLKRLDARDVVIRLAERVDSPGRVNFMDLRRPGGDGGPSRIPALSIPELTLEMGYVDAFDAWQRSGSVQLDATMRAAPDHSGWILAQLQESASTEDDGRLRVDARFHPTTLDHELRLERLKLDDARRDMLPLQVRAWWERLDLTGEIAGATVRGKANEPLVAELRLSNTGMTMPIATAGQWARLHAGIATPTDGRPRLKVDSGTVRIEGLSLALDGLSGSLIGTDPTVPIAGVPFRIDFALPDLPPLLWEHRADWLDEALAAAAFDLTIELPEFSVTADSDGVLPVVELPTVVANALAIFRLSEWRLSTMVSVSRGAPTVVPGERAADRVRLVPAQTRVEGQAYVNDARGAYRKFDYPLEDVDAHLSFDNDRVVVDYLTGRSPTGARISATGTVGPPGPNAGVDLRIVARDLSIDEALRRSLPEGVRRAVDLMIHEPSARSLRDAGLLPDDAQIAAARERRAALRADPTQAAPSEMDALDRLLKVGAFSLGGSISLELSVSRAVGTGMPTEVRGDIDLAGLAALLDRFPYPFRIVSGTIRLEPDSVHLGEPGLRIESAGGGFGLIEGHLDMPRVDGRRRLVPDLRVKLADDRVCPNLMAAIPPGTSERETPELVGWPGTPRSRTARIVEAFGVDAPLVGLVTIDTDDDGRVQWRAVVDIESGAARPDTSAASPLRELGIRLPDGTTIDGLAGQVSIDPSRLRFESVRGSIDDADLTVDGTVGLGGGEASDLVVGLRDLVIARSQLVAVPDNASEIVEELWDRHEPEGTVDLRVHYAREAGAPAAASVSLTPHAVALRVDGERIDTRFAGGVVTASASALELDALRLSLLSGERTDGELELDGSIVLGEDDWNLTGRWIGGAFESPIIREILVRLGHDAALRVVRQIEPTGRFDADFSVDATDRRLEHEVRLVPRTLDLTIGDERLIAVLDGAPLDETGPTHDPLDVDQGVVRIVPGRILLQQLRGRLGESRVAIDGTLTLREPPVDDDVDDAHEPTGVDGDLRISLDAPGLVPEIRALLPDAVCRPIDAIELEVNGRLRTTDAHLRFGRGATDWLAHLDGLFELRDATFVAGVPFRDFDGTIDLSAGGSSGGAPTLDARTTFDRLRVIDRRVTDGSGRLRLDEDGRLLHLEELRGTAYRGRIAARATVGMTDGGPYFASVSVADAGVAGISRGEAGETDADEGASGGLLTARVDIAGTLGAPQRRRGRGLLDVRGGRMAAAPITLRLLQVVQLMLPISGSLDEADASFFIDGSRLTFERLELQSDTLRLVGTGGIELDGMILDTRFSSRGRLAIFSDLMGGLTDQLFAIEVTGPLDNPRIRVLPLPGLGSLSPPRLRHHAGVDAILQDPS